MPAVIVVKAEGFQEWNEKLAGMKTRILKPKPYFRDFVVPDMEAAELQLFESQGRRGGGSWKRLTPEWHFRKIREGLDERINIASGNLRDSLVDNEHDDAIRRYVGDRLIFGTRAKGGVQSQKFRPVIRFTKFDRQRWARMWLDYIAETMRV